jgi:hypothetical protein
MLIVSIPSTMHIHSFLVGLETNKKFQTLNIFRHKSIILRWKAIH